MLLLSGFVSFVVSFLSSILLYPIMYTRKASTFSKLRGAPAVGVMILLFSLQANSEILRRKKQCDFEHNLLSSLLAFVSVGSGIISADLVRSIKGND